MKSKSTEDNLEPRYISKEVAVFGLMDKEWSHFHAIKNEPGYNYIFKVWLQLLREQVSQGKRSVRILRLESFGDEEQEQRKYGINYHKYCARNLLISVKMKK